MWLAGPQQSESCVSWDTVRTPGGRLGPFRFRGVCETSHVCPAARGLLGTEPGSLSGVLAYQLLRQPRGIHDASAAPSETPGPHLALAGAGNAQWSLGCQGRQTREPWLPGAGWLSGSLPLPQGAIWDIFKDALLSLMKYASPRLNFNVPL